jgi:integrase
MASILKRKDRYYVRFTGPDRIRRTLALGTKSERRATNARLRIEDLVSAAKTGQIADPETTVWVSKIKDDLKTKLIEFGLIESSPDNAPEVALTLQLHLDDYMRRRGDVKSSTRMNWQHTRRNLISFFGTDKPLADISLGDARDFERFLKTEARENAYAGTKNTGGLSPDTVRKRIANSKQFFQDTVDHRRISENPFHRMKSSVKGNRTRDFFVTLEMAQRVLEACPDAQWRLLFALSRFGGLRCPSEHLALRLDAVDWAADRIRVASPKTEHLDGKASREIPIFPELRPYLEEVWNQAEPGATHFVTRYRNPTQNLRTQLLKIIKRAGLDPWPKLWQNLRATRQTELEEQFPSHVVCQWIGNSRQVAAKHYLQTTPEHYAEAVSGARTIFVASRAPQGVANEKSDARQTAKTSSPAQCVALAMGVTGLEPVTSTV